jgi:nucleoporin NDC1
MNSRIADFQNPSRQSPPRPAPNLQSLPRLAAPLKEDHILQAPSAPSNRLAKIESQLGTIAKSYGQAPPSPPPLSSVVSPRAKQYLNSARQKLLTPGQQETLAPSHVRAVFHDYLLRFLRSPAGAPFRQPFQRRVRSIVFGSPYSSFGRVIDAIDALSRLAVASLTEDKFGKVFPDVPRLIRTYVSTMTAVEKFVQGMGPHWTDVEGVGDKRVEEVEAVLLALREGLMMLVEGFGEFANELGLTEKEMAAARTLAGMDPDAKAESKSQADAKAK